MRTHIHQVISLDTLRSRFRSLSHIIMVGETNIFLDQKLTRRHHHKTDPIVFSGQNYQIQIKFGITIMIFENGSRFLHIINS